MKATYGTGVFVLAHVGDEVPEAAGGLLPTVAWRIGGRTEYALDGGVFAAGEMLEWLCRELGLAPEPAALGELARGAGAPAACGSCPGITGVGAPWWRPDARGTIAGLTAGTKRAQVARAALEGIAWRVADIVGAVRESVAVDTLRVDGGLTERAGAAAAPGRRDRRPGRAGPRRRDRRGRRRARRRRRRAARLGRRHRRPRADHRAASSRSATATWREREHEAWRQFVQLAVEL